MPASAHRYVDGVHRVEGGAGTPSMPTIHASEPSASSTHAATLRRQQAHGPTPDAASVWSRSAMKIHRTFEADRESNQTRWGCGVGLDPVFGKGLDAPKRCCVAEV